MDVQSDTAVVDSITLMSVRAVLLNNYELCLAEILKEFVPTHCMSSTNTALVSKRDVPKVIVCGQSQPQEEGLFFCTRSSWLVIRALVQLFSVDGFMVVGFCHASVMRTATCSLVTVKLQHSTVQEPGCLCDRTGLIWFSLPLKYSTPFQWVVANRFSLSLASIICQFKKSSLCGDKSTSTSAIAPGLDSQVENNAVVIFDGLDAVPTLDLIAGHACQLSKSDGVESCIFEENLVQRQCRSPQGRNSDEFTEMDKFTIQEEVTVDEEITIKEEVMIKDEVKFKEEESEHNTTQESFNVGSMEVIRNLELLCEKYNNAVRGRRFLFHGSEPMLILQCPGCTAEFRGLSNRMYRLVNHVRTHEQQYYNQYMQVIAKKYQQLLGIMRRRIKFSE